MLVRESSYFTLHLNYVLLRESKAALPLGVYSINFLCYRHPSSAFCFFSFMFPSIIFLLILISFLPFLFCFTLHIFSLSSSFSGYPLYYNVLFWLQAFFSFLYQFLVKNVQGGTTLSQFRLFLFLYSSPEGLGIHDRNCSPWERALLPVYFHRCLSLAFKRYLDCCLLQPIVIYLFT